MQLGSIGVPELLVILLVVLVVFGPKRLPEVARGLARSVREFRHGLEHGLEEEPSASAIRRSAVEGLEPRTGPAAAPAGDAAGRPPSDG